MQSQAISLLLAVFTLYIIQAYGNEAQKIPTDSARLGSILGLQEEDDNGLEKSSLDDQGLGIDDVDKRNSLFRFGKRSGVFRYGKRTLFRFGKRGKAMRLSRSDSSEEPEDEGLKRTIFRYGKRDGVEDPYEYEDPALAVAVVPEDKRNNFFRYGRSRTVFRYGRSTEKKKEKRPHTPFRFGREEK
ncbi:FMRFamide-related peptides type HF-4-like [Octopus sinensis]|uniref:FMRFamide-related peptides type HF-4-like n=1 Tax=Octopus sinensis TaxID=2607531 RepID=A0A6P7TB98_9MOLL|nr:FMRFamide-related peptides type HF-4-like [Octopus sinensis]XP_036366315.1 FMRFamide-related peptides type HF-4-like [Octopus sinensis]